MSFIVRYPEERLGRDWAEPVMVEIVEPKTVCVLHYRDAPYHVWLDRNLAPVQGDNWSFTFSGQGVSGILRPKNNVAVFHAHMVSAVQCTFAEIMSNPLGFFQHLANEVDARRLSWTSYIVANEAHAEDVLSGNPGSRQEIEELLNPEAVRLKDPARMPEPLLIYEYHADGCDPPQEDCAHVSCRLEYNRSDKAYDVIPTVCIVDCYLPEPIDPTDPTVPTPPPGP
jgi:hypothetical protein